MYLKTKTNAFIKPISNIEKLHALLQEADAILIGAGAGLSTAAGLRYDGERFRRYFQDFIDAYHFTNMYEAGFYPLRHWKNIGDIGADIFIIIAMLLR